MFKFLKSGNSERLPPPEKVYPPPEQIPPEVQHHIEHLRSERRFPISASDFAVLVHFMVRFTSEGVFAPDDICRRLVMDNLPRIVDRAFGGSGIYVHTPPPGKLPYFTCLACMESKPTDTKFYQSRLTICWFQDELPRNIYTTIGERVYGVDWRTYAQDSDP